MSPRGHYLVHPNQDYIDSRTTLYGVDKTQDVDIDALGEVVLQGQSQVNSQFTDPITGNPSWVFYEPIASSGWTLGVVLIPRHVLLATATARDSMRQRRIELVLAFVVTLSALSALVCRAYRGGQRNLWAFAVSFSLLCSLGMITILYIVRVYPHDVNRERTAITNASSLRQFKNTYNQSALQHQDELPLFVPTGLFVQSITFISANDVRLTGYIWQKYHEVLHDGLHKGVVMPESESAEIKKAYADSQDHSQRIGWVFQVVLRQQFDYSRYPFSRENVWIQLWHQDFIRNVVLVPDLEAYKLTSPSALPGLLEALVLPGWDIENTFFSYRCQSYKTNFGLNDYSGLTNFPELYFNILIKTELTGPFVSHLLPLSVVFVLLFIILRLTPRENKELELFGFSTINVVTACAGFFLVVVFSHIGLRKELPAEGIIYLEYFYFASYASILFVAINAFLFSHTDNYLIHYKDNLIPKLLFLPVSQFALLAATCYTFY